MGRPWWRPLSGPLQRASGVAFSACAQCGEPLELYWRAYEQLQRQGVAQDVIDGVFAPRVPVLLPGAIERALTEPVGESDRYIDVAFGITREGRAVDVEVRAAGRDVSRAQRFKLVARIENARFRPIIRNGEMADVTPVLVRYEPPELRGGSEQGGLDSPPDSPPR